MTARSGKSGVKTDAFKRGMVSLRTTDDPVLLTYTGLVPTDTTSESSS